MTTVMILHDNPGAAQSRFRAVAGATQGEGVSAGAALDALTEQMGDAAAEGMFVVVQPLRPDSFFTEAEQAELEALMASWRTARDQNRSLPADQQARLDQLVAAELTAAGRRSAAMAKGPQP